MVHRTAVAFLLTASVALLGGLRTARASTDDSGDTSLADRLDTITVVATGVSNMSAASVGDVGSEALAAQPLLRPGALLENVPGLIVTQHSGEGKANQYFLRAFNLDHGTDLATEVDDMPVNMPTHAHGQGYSDLNFLIPELVADLHYKKGPYYADEGDFAAAGAVRMDLVTATAPSVTLGFGDDGYRRALAMGSSSLAGGTMLAAADVYHNDGPFDRPDDYRRLNGVLRYHRGGERDYYTVTAMAYSGHWSSTDQVPAHAVAEGVIDRFGSLNPSDGGISSRYSLSFNRVKRGDADLLQFSAYAIRYRLDLYSTFTYYLQDPINGDQMLQHDDRMIYGLKGSKTWFASLRDRPSSTVVGIQARVDDIRDVALDATVGRQYLSTTQDAGVIESSAAVYAENSTAWTDAVRSVIGLREDEFDFDVTDKMRSADGACNLGTDPLGCNSGRVRAHIFSPKLGLVLGPWRDLSVFLTVAEGYHSNDARGITRSGESPDAAPVTPLTRAVSAEAGVAARPLSSWHTRLDVFLLKLRSELVFEGDAGATSPSGATTRKGVEWGNTFALASWLSADVNAALSRARFDRDVDPDDLGCGDAAPGHPCTSLIAITGRHIPNSPTHVVDAGLTARHPSGWFGSIRARHFGPSPLVEDDSARSPAYTTFDLQVGYAGAAKWLVALDVFNLANKSWDDIEYYYASRLRNEATPRADYVVHPGVPRTLRGRLQFFF